MLNDFNLRPESILYVLDLTGTFVFAISGMITASQKKFDLFGATVIAFVTAIGGGTLRDVLIGSKPVGWMTDLTYIYLIISAVGITLLFKTYILRLRKTLFLFDTIGIAVFTILGLQKTLGFGLSPVIALLMGTISAVFGGVIRDILTNEIPLIFREEIYATACLFGGIVYFISLLLFPSGQLPIFVAVVSIICVRLAAVKFHWSLPKIQ